MGVRVERGGGAEVIIVIIIVRRRRSLRRLFVMSARANRSDPRVVRSNNCIGKLD